MYSNLEVLMKKIPDVLVAEMRREMDAHRVSRLEQVEYFKVTMQCGF